jgi:hypothetical protein
LRIAHRTLQRRENSQYTCAVNRTHISTGRSANGNHGHSEFARRPGNPDCRAQGLDPEDYLAEVLKQLPHNATPEQAADLTPARIAAERKAKAEVVAEQVA